MELDGGVSSGYSSCSSSTLLGSKKWQHNNKMQNIVDCTIMPPHCSIYTSAMKYYGLRRQFKTDADTAVERIERQKLLNRKRKRARQTNFESARSTGTECSSSEATCDVDEFAFVRATNVVMEEEDQIDFTDDDLIMADEQLIETQIEDNAYRIDLQLYSPESLIDADLESELSESEPSFFNSDDSDTEHEEDGYLSAEFYEAEEADSEGENEEQSALESLVNFMGNSSGSEIVRHRFPYLSMRVFLSDFMCLMSDEFVNDTIVDFCLNHLVYNLVPEELYQIHALPSTFWYIMQMELIKDASHKDDSLTEKLMRRYSRLAGFIEHADLFEQDFLVLPINSLNHWSLCVICCPNKLALEKESNEQTNVIAPQPCILMFDSQSSNKPNLEKYAKQMREFLQFAFMCQYGYTEDLAERFSDQNCPIVMPSKLPTKQANQFDCGVYALEFAKHFFNNPPSIQKIIEGQWDFFEDYPSFNISKKRASLKNEVLSMSKDRHHFERLLGYRSD